jgi:hypothetical protein
MFLCVLLNTSMHCSCHPLTRWIRLQRRIIAGVKKTRVTKKSYDEKGNEVVEVVWEEAAPDLSIAPNASQTAAASKESFEPSAAGMSS